METGAAWLAIGTLSKHTGTNVETIRYYERVRLLPAPSRSAGGYRPYGTEHLKRLSFIRRASALGFSLEEVRTLLKLADERKRPCAEVRVVAEAHLDDVRAKIGPQGHGARAQGNRSAMCEGDRLPLPSHRRAISRAGDSWPGTLGGSVRDRSEEAIPWSASGGDPVFSVAGVRAQGP